MSAVQKTNFITSDITPLSGAPKGWRTPNNVLMEQQQPLQSHIPPQEADLAKQFQTAKTRYQQRAAQPASSGKTDTAAKAHLIGYNCFNDRWTGKSLTGADGLFNDLAQYAKNHLNIDLRWCMQEPRRPEDKDFASYSLSRTFGVTNLNNLKEIDLALAFTTPLHGPQADNGTTWEMGACSALGVPTYACTNNTRFNAERGFEFAGAPAEFVRNPETADNSWTDKNGNHVENLPGERDNLMISSNSCVLTAAYNAMPRDRFTDVSAATPALKQAAIDFGTISHISDAAVKAEQALIKLSRSDQPKVAATR